MLEEEGLQRNILEGMAVVKETGKTKSHMDRHHQGVDGEYWREWWGVKVAGKTKSHMNRQHQCVCVYIYIYIYIYIYLCNQQHNTDIEI